MIKKCKLKQTFKTVKQWFLYYVIFRKCHLIMLCDNNVVFMKWNKPHRYYRCFLGGIVWKYIPNLTFKKRRYLIVDYEI